MTFGEDWGWGASKEECQKMFDLFTNLGGNFIDTSVNYTNGSSETIVGELVHSRRDAFVVATKYTLSRNWDDPNAFGNSRKNLVVSLETSLKRLQTDYIDLLWLHAWDYLTPVEEVMRALDDVVRAGKVLYVGASDSPAYITSRANMLAELRGWSPFIAVQVPYSLIDRDVEREVLPMARDLGLPVTPWGLLEGGYLTGKYDGGSSEPKRMGENLKVRERSQAILKVAQAVASEVGRSPAQVAINWVRQQKHTLIIPILGARSARHLNDNLAVLEWELSPDQMQRLTEAGKIEMGFPHSFTRNNEYIYGNMWGKIDHPFMKE
jgi:aryl-alcohol dehydrogenase-like predicted oxidoreductase